MSVEDLLRGRGNFVADVAHDGALHAAFVRSPLAHASILGIDADAARAAEGVVAVLTAADLGEVAPLVSPITVSGGGNRLAAIGRPILCAETVRHVGDPVALVLAATAAQAIDAAEMVEVDYDMLPAVASVTAGGGAGDHEIDARAPSKTAHLLGELPVDDLGSRSMAQRRRHGSRLRSLRLMDLAQSR